MPRRPKTPEERERWNAYMRDYRKKNPRPTTERRNDVPLPPTDRQVQILRLYADPTYGTQAKVAEYLGISPSAVHNQLGRLLARLGVHNATQAVYKLWVNDATPLQVPPPPKRRTDT